MSSQEKPVVTRVMVFAECDRLKASGVEPTNRKLLQELGGSMTTIAGFLREWRAQQSLVAPPAAEVVEVPATVAEAGSAAVAAIWNACHVEARREIETITEQANQRVQHVVTDRDSVLGELEAADNELKAARASVAELTDALEALRAEFTALQTQAVGREAASAATIEQMTLQIEGHTSELVRVHADLNESRQAHAAELSRLTADFARQLTEQTEAVRAANDEAARLRAKLDDESDKLAVAKAGELESFKKLTTSQAEAAAALAQVRDENTRHADAVKKLEGEMAALRAEGSESARKLAATAGECEALRAQVKSQLEVINKLAMKAEAQPEQSAGPLSKDKGTPKKDK
ncbi:hypothetical protein CR105_23075 [Massilia eurypsychrophila]|uniref:KfrA N-terminal DNA-binding domain-containing protein n=1 Tax=Massilia eurypsychrophila TaxID=1485217 RepID=A0A2G8T985_9BURK|nr:DNA-binding protein [Massilia eurypsychrophila]PIL42617.1 hypothetical protein CR105_23075 [Massilia eurypsychrophila]